MSRKPSSKLVLNVAIGAGSPVALNAEGGVPEWIMMIPAGDDVIRTVDGRGPYRMASAAALAEASLQAAGGRLPIDENHSTDLAAPEGLPSPARGWATELQARPDGLYARVEWTETGKALLAERSYRFISPVFLHTATGDITRLLRASLTNVPNLRGMAALHSEESTMDFIAQLRTLLGLADDADEAAVVAKITSLMTPAGPALNAAEAGALLVQLRTLLGLADDADVAAVVAKIKEVAGGSTEAAPALASIAKIVGLQGHATAVAIQSAVSKLVSSGSDQVKALQSELATMTTQVNTLRDDAARTKATTFVDGAIKVGRVGVAGMREHYIAQHMIDPSRVEKEINAMVVLKPGAYVPPEDPKRERLALNMQDPNAIAAEANKYRDEQAKLGRTITISDAVNVIKERAQ